MATTTPNLDLTLPAYDDLADVQVINDNFTIIDEATGDIQDGLEVQTYTENTYGFIARRFGNVVVIRAESASIPPSGEAIATLPAGMRPQERTVGFACCSQDANIQFTVLPSGACSYYYTVSTTLTYPRANVMFVVP